MARVLNSPKTSIALLLLALGTPGAAWAQATTAASVTIPNLSTQPVLYESDQKTRVTRDTTLNIANNLFSYDDCIKDRTLQYALAVVNTDTTLPLTAWVSQSQDCSQVTTRGSSGFQCWLGLPGAIPNTAAPTPFIRIQDIAHQNIGASRAGDYVAGTAADCRNLNNILFTIDFLFISGTTVKGTSAQATVTLDTVGPNPPANIESGVGEQLVNVRWDLPGSATDVSSYNVYCDDGTLEEIPASELEDDAGVGSTTSSTSGEADASTTNDAGSEGLMPLQDTTSSSGTVDTTSSSSSASGGSTARPGTSTACPSRVSLKAGELPLPSWKICGKGTGGTSAGVTVTRLGLSDSDPALQNDKPYAFAVSAFDTIGNPGPLSEVICNTPVPTQDFFDAYRAAGGQAGGCNTAGDTVATAVPASAFGLLGLALVRGFNQRRKRTNAQSR